MLEWRVSMLLTNAAQAKGSLMWQLRRRLATANDKAQVNLMFDRVARMEGDHTLAQSRQLKSRARVFAGGALDPGVYSYRQSRQAHPSGWTGRCDP